MSLLDSTPASRWRLALAQSLAEHYAQRAHVTGILVGGSTARGQADRFSDIELMVLWSEAPTDRDRREVVEKAGGDLHWLYPYDEADAVWEDTYFMGRDAADRGKSGCLVEVSHLLVRTLLDRIEQVLVRAQADEALLNLMAGLVDGHILAGEALLRPLQGRVAGYPEILRQAVVRRYGYIDHFWRWEMYLARGNNLPEVYDLFTAVLHRAMHLLLAVNHRYFEGWKWMMSMAEQCAIMPPRTPERIQSIYQTPIQEGAQILSQFVDETFDLVERQVEGTDVTSMRELFHWQRPQWETAPALRMPTP